MFVCYNNATVGNWGFNIRRLREERNMTQEELALASDMSRPTITAIELGRNKAPTDRNLKGFCKAFQMSIEQLNQELYSKTSPPSLRGITGELSPTEIVEMVMLRLRGSIAAGEPETEEEEFREIREPFPKYLLKGASSGTYVLRVRGNSLIGDGLHKGDIVAVDPGALDIIDGKVYAVRIGNETVARHVTRLDGKVRLSSSDGAHEDIYLDKLEVRGRIIARFNWGKM